MERGGMATWGGWDKGFGKDSLLQIVIVMVFGGMYNCHMSFYFQEITFEDSYPFRSNIFWSCFVSIIIGLFGTMIFK